METEIKPEQIMNLIYAFAIMQMLLWLFFFVVMYWLRKIDKEISNLKAQHVLTSSKISSFERDIILKTIAEREKWERLNTIYSEVFDG